MNAEYPLSHAYFERAILIGPVLKQPMTTLISNWKVSDTDDEKCVYTGIQTVSVIWKLSFFAFSLQIPIVYSAARGRAEKKWEASCFPGKFISPG